MAPDVSRPRSISKRVHLRWRDKVGTSWRHDQAKGGASSTKFSYNLCAPLLFANDEKQQIQTSLSTSYGASKLWILSSHAST